MRKSSARKDIDFNYEDEEEGAPRSGRLLSLFGGNPAARIGSAGLAALVVAILVNVVFLQDQRHAAPLFQMSLRSAPPASAPDRAPPLPAPRPADLPQEAQPLKAVPTQQVPARADAVRDPIAREIARLDQPPARLERSKSTEPTTADAKRSDAIGGLIKSVGAAPQASDIDASVAAAQRALMKLGFVLRPDGVFGASTRQAIEAFERDNRLPVHGELTRRIKVELARQSGVEIR